MSMGWADRRTPPKEESVYDLSPSEPPTVEPPRWRPPTGGGSFGQGSQPMVTYGTVVELDDCVVSRGAWWTPRPQLGVGLLRAIHAAPNLRKLREALGEQVFVEDAE